MTARAGWTLCAHKPHGGSSNLTFPTARLMQRPSRECGLTATEAVVSLLLLLLLLLLSPCSLRGRYIRRGQSAGPSSV